MCHHLYRILRLRAAAFGLLAAVVGCGDERAAGSGEVIAVLPLGGSFSAKGDFHKAGIQMALVDLERAGLNDHIGGSFHVTPVSSANGAEAVRQEVEGLVAQFGTGKTVAIISSTGAAHEGSLPVALAHGIPHFEVASGSNDSEFIAEGSGYDLSYAFSTRPWCYYLAEMAADLVAAHPEWGNVLLMRGNGVHDVVHTTIMRQRLTEVHGQGSRAIDVGDAAAFGDFLVDYNKGTFDQEIASAMATYNPGAIWYHLRGDTHNLRFLQDAQRVGFTGTVATCNMSRTPEIIDPVQNGGISDYLVDHLMYVSRGPVKSAALTTFKTDFQAMFGVAADTFTPSAYDAMILAGLAVARAGFGDPAAVRRAIVDVAREGEKVGYGELARAIELIRGGADIDYDGPSGSLDFRDDRSVPGDYFVEGVQRTGDAYGYYELSNPPRAQK